MPSSDEKELFRQRIFEASKFIVASGYQMSIISINSCHGATDLAVVPELRGVLEHPELPLGHATDQCCINFITKFTALIN